ncbi:EVE domain-containing protein [Reinekea marina]|uniref:EVE domain-containing protein n=2 Tax=Reinekea marina TaxID=1310421 RepID=A0ABV7WY32_9GAMM
MTSQYWLLKTEPNEFSIDDLKAKGSNGEPWDGIRNYQARNFMREMAMGDTVLIYHSACAVPAIVGEGKIIKTAYDDHFALDPKSKYFDEKSSADKNRWSLVDVAFVEKWQKPVPLSTIKTVKALSEMKLVKQSRLSVSPVTADEYEVLITLK